MSNFPVFKTGVDFVLDQYLHLHSGKIAVELHNNKLRSFVAVQVTSECTAVQTWRTAGMPTFKQPYAGSCFLITAAGHGITHHVSTTLAASVI
jgi:hypothetical protein